MVQIRSIHVIQSNETLSQIAKKYKISLQTLLEVNQQIQNPELFEVGEAINIPGSAPLTEALVLEGPPVTFDGIHPAPGTTVANRAKFTNPPLKNTVLDRNPSVYAQVIDQFAVGHNPRHLRADGNTFCNIFLWDVTRAMGAEIPHWINAAGAIAVPFSTGAREININAGVDWLKNHGAAHGWTVTDAQTAQDSANQGKVAVVVWKNPIVGGHGHTAVVRPGTITIKGPTIAQAGGINFNVGHVKDSFGNKPAIKFYRHD